MQPQLHVAHILLRCAVHLGEGIRAAPSPVLVLLLVLLVLLELLELLELLLLLLAPSPLPQCHQCFVSGSGSSAKSTLLTAQNEQIGGGRSRSWPDSPSL
jgi:hypothetical protein